MRRSAPHRTRPDPPRDAADHRVLGIHPVREEEAQVRREVVDRHSAREVVLDDREAVRQRERELVIGFAPASAMWYPLIETL
jgi:hypothetical protein